MQNYYDLYLCFNLTCHASLLFTLKHVVFELCYCSSTEISLT